MGLRIAAVISAVSALAAAGCTTTFGVVDPHPNVMVLRVGSPYAVDASRVPDAQPFKKRVVAEHVRESIERGFRNAVGSMFAPAPVPGVFVLVIDEATIEQLVVGEVDVRYLIDIRFRAHWRLPDGRDLVEVSGVAYPRRPFDESNAEMLQDTLGVMLGGMIGALDEAFRRMPPPERPSVPSETL